MSRPLIVIDADVLGRQRTGDETYVTGLLRELASSDLRLAAVTRHPELVPKGIEPIELQASSQVLRMSIGLPRLLRRLRPALAHFQHSLPLACPSPAVVTVHDLSFERDPSVMGRRDRLIFRTVSPPLHPTCGALEQGGNAVDAALAAAAMLTVCEPPHNGVGGDTFALLWFDGALHGLNGSGRAPAHIDELSVDSDGPRSVTVPGAVRAWATPPNALGASGSTRPSRAPSTPRAAVSRPPRGSPSTGAARRPGRRGRPRGRASATACPTSPGPCRRSPRAAPRRSTEGRSRPPSQRQLALGGGPGKHRSEWVSR